MSARGHYIFCPVQKKVVRFGEHKHRIVPWTKTSPQVRTDTIAPTMCHGDGGVYTSRARLAEAQKISGVEVVSGREMGSKLASPKPDFAADIRDDIQRAESLIKNDGYKPEPAESFEIERPVFNTKSEE